MSSGRVVAVILVGCVLGSFLGVISIELGTGYISSISSSTSLLSRTMIGLPSSTHAEDNESITTRRGDDPVTEQATGGGGDRPASDIFQHFPTEPIISTVCDSEEACRSANRRDVIHTLRGECAAFRESMLPIKSPVSSREGLVVNDISSEVVCFHRGELYSDDEESRRKIFVRRSSPEIRLEMKDLTKSLPLSKAAKLTLSTSIAMTMMDVQAGYHLFHLLADNVLPLAWHLYGNPSPNVSFLERIRRSIVFTTTSSQRHQIGKCMACVELGEVFSPRVHYAHVDDDAIQCFCAGYFSGVVYLPYHEEMYTNTERSQALRWLQSVLARHFDLPPYTGKSLSSVNTSSTVEPSTQNPAAAVQIDSISPSSSQDAQAASAAMLPPIRTRFRMNGQPRLLLVQRKTRSIGPINEIYQQAVNIGYDVAFTFFEGLPMRKQFRLARYADVFVSIHGMALTWAFAMDGSTLASRGCRTMIELRHYVRPFPLKLQFYKHIASSANLTYVEIPATTCKFGKSVRHPEKEYNRMFLASFVIGLRGFHDQVAAYNVSQVSEAMKAAFDRAKLCPA